MSIREIKGSFNRNGIRYELLRVVDVVRGSGVFVKVGLYELYYLDDVDKVVGWDVHVLRLCDVPFGDGSEQYWASPSTAKWGQDGFSYCTLCEAVNKFNELCIIQ